MSAQQEKLSLNSVQGNPLKFDPELKALLDKIDFVKTYKAFTRWRGSFLNRFEAFLEQDGIEHADRAYRDFSKSMESFVKDVNKVNEFIDKGELAVDNYTVKARRCFAEMCKRMTQVIEEEDALIPSTGALEKKRGYNKFHMGSVLVRDSFEEYGRLTQCGDVLKHMRDVSLNQVADKQILEEMDNYRAKLQKFCDVMADLGLYEVMLKCREFAMEEDAQDEIIFLDLKTGGIGELDRGDILEKKLLTLVSKTDDGKDVFSEACTDEENQEKLRKMIKLSNKLGLGFGIQNNTYEDEDVKADAARIANMWGVKLKKTEKNTKGEEFIFVDQKSGAFGELSRKMFVARGVLTEIKDENGKVILGEAEHDFEERSNLVETLRSVLKLGVATN
jgi:hypothetical protein